jgi:hypothetical protein
MRIAIAAAMGLMLVFPAAGAVAAAKPAGKGPPACAAIKFRAVPAGMSDGKQPAGMYKSRFGRLELSATVKGGTAADYRVEANGKPLGAPPASLPATAAQCAAQKKLPAPEKPAASCSGERFTVLIDHEGDERLALLYGLQGNSWQFCSAGTF